MKNFYLESVNKIKRNKKTLEKELSVKISFKGKKVMINGYEINEYVAEKVIEAIDMGFSLKNALMLKDENFVFERLLIKSITRRKNLKDIKGRIVGSKGRTKRAMESLSNCHIVLHNSEVGIIGNAEDIHEAVTALTSLIRGSRQSNVYKFLERTRIKRKKEELL